MRLTVNISALLLAEQVLTCASSTVPRSSRHKITRTLLILVCVCACSCPPVWVYVCLERSGGCSWRENCWLAADLTKECELSQTTKSLKFNWCVITDSYLFIFIRHYLKAIVLECFFLLLLLFHCIRLEHIIIFIGFCFLLSFFLNIIYY